jgi:hypothetical protein
MKMIKAGIVFYRTVPQEITELNMGEIYKILDYTRHFGLPLRMVRIKVLLPGI